MYPIPFLFALLKVAMFQGKPCKIIGCLLLYPVFNFPFVEFPFLPCHVPRWCHGACRIYSFFIKEFQGWEDFRNNLM